MRKVQLQSVHNPLLSRFAYLFVFAAVAVIGAGITVAIHTNERDAKAARFEVIADEAVDRIRNRVHQHIALIVAAAAHIGATSIETDRPTFERYVSGLGLDDEFEGIQGIGVARILRHDEEETASRRLADAYGIERKIWPSSDEAIRTAIMMLEPMDARNAAALGFDMYSEARRREAMSRAINTGETSATAPVMLVQEITSIKQAGFLVFIPIGDKTAGHITGFAFAPFRAGDLHRAALSGRNLHVEIETRDTSARDDAVLYVSEGFADSARHSRFEVVRQIAVGGRTWQITLREAATYRDRDTAPYALITGLISLLLATALAAATRWQQQSVDRARAFNALAEQSIQEKDLMLQEMKHRIKNSIARILAMARQTASANDDFETFMESFAARLQSMANAQDMLTRTHWQHTDLRELLDVELLQVYGTAAKETDIKGPPIKIDGRQTQALGLTFHELATNSLKYGAGSVEDGRLSITWRIERSTGRGRELRLIWDEITGMPSEAPRRRGFGARLIDASITGEMAGRIDRDFHQNGLTITIRFPISAAAV